MFSRAVRALCAATIVAALCAVVPAAAGASTWTVDDDGQQCPNAGFTKIQAAVNQAAPWDTIKICDGTYLESSQPVAPVSPSNPDQLPIQAGSRNGVTITKPLTLKGAGASKVTIQPDPAVATSLAGTAPYLRDGGGNVISVLRQSAGSTDDNENRVNISGVTVKSPGVYAEAGIAFFNTSGTIENSVVGPLTRAADAAELAARPHGWGIVMTNHMQGVDSGGITRQLNISGTLVTGYQSGGVLFDGARGADGAATLLQRSGIRAYGRITASTIQGSGPDGVIPQTGVRWHAGQRGSITKSTIAGHYFTPDPRQSVGVLLTDAETGQDPANPTERAWWALENRITGNGYGMFNANAANDAVRVGAPASATSVAAGLENWWGCTAGPVVGAPSTTDAATSCQGISGDDTTPAASIQRGSTRASAPFLPAVPAPTADAKPTLTVREPAGPLVAGQAVEPVVTATDDFGVKAVKLTVDGTTDGGTLTKTPYAFDDVVPSFDRIGSTVAFKFDVTDSAGQVTTQTVTLPVVAPAGYDPLAITATKTDLGDVLVGESAATELTVANTGETDVTLGAIAVTGDGYSAGDDGCAAGDVLAAGETCTLDVTFAPTAVGDEAGAVQVAYTAPGATGPDTLALTAKGYVKPPPPVVAATPDPPLAAPPTAAPPPTPAPVTAPPIASSRPPALGTTTLRTKKSVPSSRKIDLGTFTCGASACTVKLTGTLKLGGKTYRATATPKAGAGKRVRLEVRLSRAAYRALRRAKARAGKLGVTLVVTAGGRTSTRTQSVDLKA